MAPDAITAGGVRLEAVRVGRKPADPEVGDFGPVRSTRQL